MQKLKKPELCRFKQRTETLQANNHKHHLHPFSDNGALAQEGARVIEKGAGRLSLRQQWQQDS
ncbi:adenosylmethionine-8-amino-7-oxononanoate aminotransferase [Endozoicomonas sp. NE35]